MNNYNKYEKIFESLPRQSTVDQLKRIREEIKKSQNIKVGPEESEMKGDIGDRVIKDLMSHKGKQEMNNLFWWDNPLDRHIDSYETFVHDDSRNSLGYTKKGDPKSHKGTDYVKENKNIEIKKFGEYHNINESILSKLSPSYAMKFVKFFKKIKHLFNDIDLDLSLSKIKELIVSENPENVFDEDFIEKIQNIINSNENEIQMAYDEIFGINEEFGFAALIISVLFGIGFYYAFSRGYFNGIFRWIDRKIGRGGCRSCGDESGEEWKNKKKIKTKKVELPIRKPNVDEILDKIAKKGMKSLTPEEKAILKKHG